MSSNKQNGGGSSGGTTSVIRKRLNFTDEALWKQFSSRRLQLVDSLSLSSKKASEQDEEIKICATTLLHEFNFPESTINEFDKLVRLAIQSVRRNKKRSEKRLASKLETLTSDDEQYLLYKKPKLHESDEHHDDYDSGNENDHDIQIDGEYTHHNNQMNFLSNVLIDDLNKDNGSNANNTRSLSNNSNNSHNKSDNRNTKDNLEHLDSRVAINSLVSAVIPDTDKLPSLKKLDENVEFTKASKILLHKIKNSKSCYEFSKTSNNNTKNYDLLEEFGSACITSSVLYTLEKWFDHLLPDSSSYIKLRLKSDLTLGLIVKSLDSTSVEVNRLSNFVASQLFKKLIGGCVKDFGFNAVLNPLCDIFHSIILKDYPIISKDQFNKNTNSRSLTPSNENSHMKSTNYFKDLSIIDAAISQPQNSTFTANLNNSNNHPSTDVIGSDHKLELSSSELPDFPLSTAYLPMVNMDSAPTMRSPPILRSKQLTNVTIKFKDKELNFRYNMDSNAPPTLLELIENCKQAFGIISSSRVLSLKNFSANRIIKTDHDLERLLRMAAMLSNDGTGTVVLELVFANVTQGYLNLNHDSSMVQEQSTRQIQSPIQIKTELPPQPQAKTQVQVQGQPLQVSKSQQSSIDSSLIGRYLPPPRPVRPETVPMNGFMKFQPLL